MPARLKIESPRDDRFGIAEAYGKLRKSGARLIGPDGHARELPRSIDGFLERLRGDLMAKHPVAIIQANSTLTTVQASQLLGVSRQHLVNLLENGAIPFHKVGTHRRVYAGDLLRYKEKRDSRRRQAISDFAALEQDAYLDS
jgi:excisionase family DNA binding protein